MSTECGREEGREGERGRKKRGGGRNVRDGGSREERDGGGGGGGGEEREREVKQCCFCFVFVFLFFEECVESHPLFLRRHMISGKVAPHLPVGRHLISCMNQTAKSHVFPSGAESSQNI